MKPLPAGLRLSTPDYYEYTRGRQHHARIFAWKKEPPMVVVGKITYVVTPDAAHVQMIEVEPSYRRSSLATRLFLSMVADTAPLPVHLGMLTSEGTSFFRSLLGSRPKLFAHPRFDKAKRAVGL
jgi:hypothetical protein